MRRTKTPSRSSPTTTSPLPNFSASNSWDDRFFDAESIRLVFRHTSWCIIVSVLGWCLFADCCNGLSQRFSDYSTQVQFFAHDTPIRFQTFVDAEDKGFLNITDFRVTTAKWHHDLRELQNNIENKFRLEFEADWENDGFVPVCTNVRFAYQTFMLSDGVVLVVLLGVVLRILYKDLCTVYGANRHSVNLQFHIVLASLECLLILNWPLFRLSMSAVDLSHQFKKVVDALKKIQVELLVSDNPQIFDDLYLRASIWEGKRFGVREPLSGIHLDDVYDTTLRTRAYLLTFFIAVGISVLMYRASIRSFKRWRRNVNAVCSIGIVVPNGKTIFRVGSGVLVNGVDTSGRAYRRSVLSPLVVTNWHCLHDIVDTSRTAGDQQRSSLRLRTHVDVLRSTTSLTRKSCSYDAPGWKILIGVRDVEGSGGREDIRWLYSGTTVMESPMREFVPNPAEEEQREKDVATAISTAISTATATATSTGEIIHGNQSEDNGNEGNENQNENKNTNGNQPPRMTRQQSELYDSSSILPSSSPVPSNVPDFRTGIDITVLKISNQINVHGLRKSSNNRNYIFDSIEVVQSSGITNNNSSKDHNIKGSSSATPLSPTLQIPESIRRLPRFDGTHDSGRGAFAPLSVRMSDQLRLMGYPPDAGGYEMSILTTFFTGIDYEDRQSNTGRYLLANSVLPNGFSGGAAVNDDGELVGICTAEHGQGISCIRDYVDVRPLVVKASQRLMATRKWKNSG